MLSTCSREPGMKNARRFFFSCIMHSCNRMDARLKKKKKFCGGAGASGATKAGCVTEMLSFLGASALSVQVHAASCNLGLHTFHIESKRAFLYNLIPAGI